MDDNKNKYMDNNMKNNNIYNTYTINLIYASDIKFKYSNTYSNFGYLLINQPNKNIYNNNYDNDNENDDNNFIYNKQ